ncbi:hypothetical protein C4573_02100 [Candidatus Woesearchaeota archaeon]|nr:MAG: hypothetical protein C4573_02100 [Candidatus Woesearchaeota archaeon]
MKIFHTNFPSGLQDAQLLHTETGISIAYEYNQPMFGQATSDITGMMAPDVFQRGIDAVIGKGERLVLRSENSHPESIFDDNQGGPLIYVLRDISVSAEVQRQFEMIRAYCHQHQKPKRFTVEDESWLRQITSQFPEYRECGFRYVGLVVPKALAHL